MEFNCSNSHSYTINMHKLKIYKLNTIKPLCFDRVTSTSPQRGLAAYDSTKPPRIFSYLKLSPFLLKLRGLFIGSKEAPEALGNLENSEFNHLVKLGTNPSTNQNRIHPNLPPISGRFWHSIILI
jgi:hypothetical protein